MSHRGDGYGHLIVCWRGVIRIQRMDSHYREKMASVYLFVRLWASKWNTLQEPKACHSHLPLLNSDDPIWLCRDLIRRVCTRTHTRGSSRPFSTAFADIWCNFYLVLFSALSIWNSMWLKLKPYYFSVCPGMMRHVGHSRGNLGGMPSSSRVFI